MTLRELSLFSGAGGGLLGSLLLGWRPIGYVEFNEYCQRVIAQRIEDGILPTAPIFGDVREFVQSGAAREYCGFADVVSGGFPCQPFSVAGKRAGADDPRDMWPATAECVRIVRPRYCFFENVPGLLNSGYFGTIVSDLAASGYGVRWRCLSAAEVGAPHKRDRLWIVAYATGARLEGQQRAQFEGTRVRLADRSQAVPDPQRDRDGWRQQPAQGSKSQWHLHNAPWWEVEPDVGRVVDGVASRVDRLRGLGNGQVPLVAATAWHLLTEDLL